MFFRSMTPLRCCNIPRSFTPALIWDTFFSMSGLSRSHSSWCLLLSCLHWMWRSLFSFSVYPSFLLGRMLHIFSKSFLLRFKVGETTFWQSCHTYLIYWFACKVILMGVMFRSDLNKQEILDVSGADS